MTTNEESREYRQHVTRTNFLQTVIDFVRLIAGKSGKLLERTAGSGYVHTVHEIYNFENFSFIVDTNQSMIGGNSVKIWYHPDKPYEQELAPVLNMWWQLEVNSAKVLVFESNRKWQNEILKAVKRQRDREFIARQTVEPAQKHVLTQYEEEVRQQHLAERAKTLGNKST